MVIVYAVLALCGLIVPWIFNIEFIHAHGGFSWATFLAEAFSVPAARSVGSDLAIACAAFVAWMVREARRLGMRHWWIYIALIFVVAFAFACPLFLLMRERRLREVQPNATA
jgi:hypothetical protein